jgi:hypothetical protein
VVSVFGPPSFASGGTVGSDGSVYWTARRSTPGSFYAISRRRSPAGGLFPPVRPRSPEPNRAVNAHGEGLTWLIKGTPPRIYARFRSPAGREFGRAHYVARLLRRSAGVSGGLDDHGNAFFVWTMFAADFQSPRSGTYARRLSASGRLGPIQSFGRFDSPSVDFAPDGGAVVGLVALISPIMLPADGLPLRVARAAPGRMFSAPVTVAISRLTPDDFYPFRGPKVAAGAGGRAAYMLEKGRPAHLFAALAPPAGPFGPQQELTTQAPGLTPTDGVSGYRLELAPNGSAVAAWTQTGEDAATHARLMASFSAVAPPGRAFAAPGLLDVRETLYVPRLAIGPRGQAIAAWTRYPRGPAPFGPTAVMIGSDGHSAPPSVFTGPGRDQASVANASAGASGVFAVTWTANSRVESAIYSP